MKIFQKIYEVVRNIPAGKVATYGQIAKIAGTTPRIVGFALHSLAFVQGKPIDLVSGKPNYVPCHRVVNRFGSLANSFAFGGKKEQLLRLKDDGISFESEPAVKLEKYLIDSEVLSGI